MQRVGRGLSGGVLGGPPGATVLVYAPTLADARQHLATVVNAMQPDDAPFDARTIQWKDAPREHRPVRLVLPGVQFVLS